MLIYSTEASLGIVTDITYIFFIVKWTFTAVKDYNHRLREVFVDYRAPKYYDDDNNNNKPMVWWPYEVKGLPVDLKSTCQKGVSDHRFSIRVTRGQFDFLTTIIFIISYPKSQFYIFTSPPGDNFSLDLRLRKSRTGAGILIHRVRRSNANFTPPIISSSTS